MAGLHDRVERAEVIARSPGQIEKVTDSVYSVKAQSGNGVYLMSSEAGRWKCLCPDFNSHSLLCKHILAVQLKLKGITVQAAFEGEFKRPRPTYRQNWTAYNAAQKAQPVWFGRVWLTWSRTWRTLRLRSGRVDRGSRSGTRFTAPWSEPPRGTLFG
jgi:SWIM zinc finger